VRSLPAKSRLLLLCGESELKQEATQLSIKELLRRFKDRSFRTSVAAWEKTEIAKLIQGPYRAVLVSIRLWDHQRELLERYPKFFWKIGTCLNSRSIDSVKNKLGFLV